MKLWYMQWWKVMMDYVVSAVIVSVVLRLYLFPLLFCLFALLINLQNQNNQNNQNDQNNLASLPHDWMRSVAPPGPNFAVLLLLIPTLVSGLIKRFNKSRENQYGSYLQSRIANRSAIWCAVVQRRTFLLRWLLRYGKFTTVSCVSSSAGWWSCW